MGFVNSAVMKLKVFVRNIVSKPEIGKLSVGKRAEMLRIFYREKMGRELNLEAPVTFTEKLQWYKLYYAHPEMKRCVDKHDFKQYVLEKIGQGYTAPLIQVWNDPSEVSIRDIPANKFVLKSTLQSDGNFIILVKDKSEIDIETVEHEIKTKWFDTKLLLTNSFCSAYYGAKPRVIVEEFIEEFADCANDYKIFCFHGKPAFFYVAEEHFKDGKQANSVITFMDLDWNMMDVTYGSHPRNPNVAKPMHFEEMVQLATKLSPDFPFVRVDFFDTKDKLYLAELTFYPGGGITHYHPESFDKKMGDMLQLPLNRK